MKPIFTLEYFCYFFTEPWWGVLMHKKLKLKRKKLKRRSRSGLRM